VGNMVEVGNMVKVGNMVELIQGIAGNKNSKF